MRSGSTKVSRDVITTRPVDVPTPTVRELTSASPAEALNHSTNALLASSFTPILNYDAFAAGLSSHPDNDFVSRILSYIRDGVPVGYTGPRVHRVCKNWPSATQFRSHIAKVIKDDIALGRKLGPFDHAPSPNFVASPMGAFQKHSGKLRIIQDLSWPPGRSVNDFISREDYSVHYITDSIISRIQLYGRHSLLAKLDLADAFRHIMVRKENWELLGSVFEETIDGVTTRRFY